MSDANKPSGSRSPWLIQSIMRAFFTVLWSKTFFASTVGLATVSALVGHLNAWFVWQDGYLHIIPLCQNQFRVALLVCIGGILLMPGLAYVIHCNRTAYHYPVEGQIKLMLAVMIRVGAVFIAAPLYRLSMPVTVGEAVFCLLSLLAGGWLVYGTLGVMWRYRFARFSL